MGMPTPFNDTPLQSTPADLRPRSIRDRCNAGRYPAFSGRLDGGASVLSGAFLALVEEHGQQVEAKGFIAACFEQKFAARLSSFMPRLFTLRDATGQIRGAMGLRHARDPLYLEQYLGLPIEQVVARHTGHFCERNDIVEVGHLCGAFAGAKRALIDQLTRRLEQDGLGWVTFTGTPSLRNAFHRLGLRPIEVAAALPEAIPEVDRSAWGRYYDDGPRVFIGSVRVGSTLLDSRRTPCRVRRFK